MSLRALFNYCSIRTYKLRPRNLISEVKKKVYYSIVNLDSSNILARASERARALLFQFVQHLNPFLCDYEVFDCRK